MRIEFNKIELKDGITWDDFFIKINELAKDMCEDFSCYWEK